MTVEVVDVAATVCVVGNGDLAGGLGVGRVFPNVDSSLAAAELAVVTVARIVATGLGGLVTDNLITTVADAMESQTGVTETVALAYCSTLLNSHSVGVDCGAHNESSVSIVVAAFAGEWGVLIGTGWKLIVVGCGERSQGQGGGNSHQGAVEGHGQATVVGTEASW